MNNDPQSECEVCRRIELCQEGSNPCFVAELETGYVVLGDSQYFEGYCLFLHKMHLEHIQRLGAVEYQRHALELREVGAAIQAATGCERVNYELLGNTLHHVHWHLFPRRSTDPVPSKPVWIQMPTEAERAETMFSSERHGALACRLREEIQDRVGRAEGSKGGKRPARARLVESQQGLFE